MVDYELTFTYNYMKITNGQIHLTYWNNDTHSIDGKSFKTLFAAKDYAKSLTDLHLKQLYENHIQILEETYHDLQTLFS
jgi:hypothetical protein